MDSPTILLGENELNMDNASIGFCFWQAILVSRSTSQLCKAPNPASRSIFGGLDWVVSVKIAIFFGLPMDFGLNRANLQK